MAIFNSYVSHNQMVYHFISASPFFGTLPINFTDVPIRHVSHSWFRTIKAISPTHVMISLWHKHFTSFYGIHLLLNAMKSHYSLVNKQFAIDNGHRNSGFNHWIIDSMVSFHSYVNVYQRVYKLLLLMLFVNPHEFYPS